MYTKININLAIYVCRFQDKNKYLIYFNVLELFMMSYFVNHNNFWIFFKYECILMNKCLCFMYHIVFD